MKFGMLVVMLGKNVMSIDELAETKKKFFGHPTLHPNSRSSSQGNGFIQATLITVRIGSFGGSPWQVTRAA